MVIVPTNCSSTFTNGEVSNSGSSIATTHGTPPTTSYVTRRIYVCNEFSQFYILKCLLLVVVMSKIASIFVRSLVWIQLGTNGFLIRKNYARNSVNRQKENLYEPVANSSNAVFICLHCSLASNIHSTGFQTVKMILVILTN